jgi:hypothetical protein
MDFPPIPGQIHHTPWMDVPWMDVLNDDRRMVLAEHADRMSIGRG